MPPLIYHHQQVVNIDDTVADCGRNVSRAGGCAGFRTQSPIVDDSQQIIDINGKRVFGWWGGDIVANAGWATFFGATAAMAIPGLLLIFVLPRSVIEPPARAEAEPQGS